MSALQCWQKMMLSQSNSHEACYSNRTENCVTLITIIFSEWYLLRKLFWTVYYRLSYSFFTTNWYVNNMSNSCIVQVIEWPTVHCSGTPNKRHLLFNRSLNYKLRNPQKISFVFASLMRKKCDRTRWILHWYYREYLIVPIQTKTLLRFSSSSSFSHAWF